MPWNCCVCPCKMLYIFLILLLLQISFLGYPMRQDKVRLYGATRSQTAMYKNNTDRFSLLRHSLILETQKCPDHLRSSASFWLISTEDSSPLKLLPIHQFTNMYSTYWEIYWFWFFLEIALTTVFIATVSYLSGFIKISVGIFQISRKSIPWFFFGLSVFYFKCIKT